VTDFRSKPPQDQRARTSGIGKWIDLESPLAGRIATNRQGAAISGGTTLTRMGIGHLGPVYYYSRKRSRIFTTRWPTVRTIVRLDPCLSSIFTRKERDPVASQARSKSFRRSLLVPTLLPRSKQVASRQSVRGTERSMPPATLRRTRILGS